MGRIYEGPLEIPGLGASPGTNRRETVAGVLAEPISRALVVAFVVGSSTSFSVLIRGCLLFNLGDNDEAASPGRPLLRRLPPALVRAANGPALPDDAAALREAKAVFADMEAVGGPDTNIDRKGGSNEAAEMHWSP